MSKNDVYAIVAMLAAQTSMRPVRRLNAMEILQGRRLPLPRCSSDIDAQEPPKRPDTRRNISERSARVYQREDAVMKLVDAVYRHFDDHVHADNFLNQRLDQLGGLSPLKFVACDRTFAEAMSYLRTAVPKSTKRRRTRG